MTKTWRVKITELVCYVVEGIAAESEEAAQDYALELFPGDGRIEILDSNVESVEVEAEDE